MTLIPVTYLVKLWSLDYLQMTPQKQSLWVTVLFTGKYLAFELKFQSSDRLRLCSHVSQAENLIPSSNFTLIELATKHRLYQQSICLMAPFPLLIALSRST
jgi:hypothetical protein